MWMSPVVQSSPLPENWWATIHRPVCPLASVPVILNRCHEAVNVTCVGPAR